MHIVEACVQWGAIVYLDTILYYGCSNIREHESLQRTLTGACNEHCCLGCYNHMLWLLQCNLQILHTAAEHTCSTTTARHACSSTAEEHACSTNAAGNAFRTTAAGNACDDTTTEHAGSANATYLVASVRYRKPTISSKYAAYSDTHIRYSCRKII